ncbi:hypothetical protein CPB86DRAFT_710079 [Serendipita vermifera]|nr:hypothetical protein CPB86DRAFT_710079 [Serendipita vermifera]
MDPSSVSVTPVYVIHVKSSSNNTIITLHGPSTPKSLVISSTQDGRAAGKTKSRQATSEDKFSVESNPDAAEPSLSTELSSDSPATPLRMSSTFSLPTANRCVGWASGGSCHYKKVNRSTYEAGYAASVRIVRRVEEVFRHIMEGGRIEDLPPMKEVKGAQEGSPPRPASGGSATNFMRIRVVYTGFGVGRDAFNAAILSAEGSFVRGLIGQVQDKTPIKIGGCRGRKIRRI